MKHESTIDPELEARVVAWVLGEASPFEAAELERRVAADPELAVFKRRIEAVHGLLGQAVPQPTASLRLSAERRAKLLAVIGGPAPAEESRPSVLSLPLLHRTSKWQLPLWAYSATAACVLVGVILFTTLPHFSLVKEKPVALESPNVGQAVMFKDAETDEAVRESVRQAEGMKVEESRRRVEEAKRREKVVAAAAGTADAPKLNRIAAAPRIQVPATASSLLDNVRQQQTIGGANVPADRSEMMFGYGTRSFGAVKRAGTMALAASPTPQPTSIVSSGSMVVSGGAAALPDEADQPEKTVEQVAHDEPIVLSPFAITAETEGYAASSTLAGTRIQTRLPSFDAANITLRGGRAASAPRTNTQLRDQASAVSVVTDEFLKDVGATNKTTVLGPAGKAEVAGVQSGAATAIGGAEPVIQVQPADLSPPATGMAEAQTQPVSTFSLHVSDVSFKLAQAALAKGEKPDAATIRPEEFYNAFDYGDPSPVSGEPVACRIEEAAHPLAQQRTLVRIALRVPAVGRDAAQPLRLTVLLDTSGSMQRDDRVESVRRAFEVLASLLSANDRVTVIGFARQPRLIAKSVAGNEAKKLVDLIAATPAEGGTNFEEALKLAAEQARGQFVAAAQNRIVVLSDGAANLGADDPAQLSNRVAALRQEGISFDACGVGIDGLDDAVLEALTRKGNGRYYVVNSIEEADAGFARKLAGALHPAAQNVKVQVRFNPSRVQSYRLIGFEQHRLREEDFRNDQVTAAELAGNEDAVAVYEVQSKPDGEGELGDVFVRFRETASGAMVERSWTLMYDPRTPAFDHASPSTQLAGVSALLAEKLQGRGAGAQLRLADLVPVVNELRAHYAHDRRVQEFVTMFDQARRLYPDER